MASGSGPKPHGRHEKLDGLRLKELGHPPALRVLLISEILRPALALGMETPGPAKAGEEEGRGQGRSMQGGKAEKVKGFPGGLLPGPGQGPFRRHPFFQPRSEAMAGQEFEEVHRRFCPVPAAVQGPHQILSRAPGDPSEHAHLDEATEDDGALKGSPPGRPQPGLQPTPGPSSVTKGELFQSGESFGELVGPGEWNVEGRVGDADGDGVPLLVGEIRLLQQAAQEEEPRLIAGRFLQALEELTQEGSVRGPAAHRQQADLPPGGIPQALPEGLGQVLLHLLQAAGGEVFHEGEVEPAEDSRLLLHQQPRSLLEISRPPFHAVGLDGPVSVGLPLQGDVGESPNEGFSIQDDLAGRRLAVRLHPVGQGLQVDPLDPGVELFEAALGHRRPGFEEGLDAQLV